MVGDLPSTTVLMIATPHAGTWWASLPAAVAKITVAAYAWTSTTAPCAKE